jgi:hypothetical protein
MIEMMDGVFLVRSGVVDISIFFRGLMMAGVSTMYVGVGVGFFWHGKW